MKAKRRRRSSRRFTIGFMCCAGVINTTCAAASHSGLPAATDNYVYDQRSQETSEITFHPGDKAASGGLPDGTRFSVQDYQSSDGVDVSVRIDRCPSAAIAKKNLLKFIRSAHIEERGSKTDLNGTVVGERFVVQFPAKGKFKAQFGIVWVNKTEVYYVQSSSLPHAKQFEKSSKF
jgi:hypothetical protein